MTATIYHNPACGTSRKVLAALKDSGVEPRIVEYLKTPPSRDKLAALLRAMGMSARELLRKKGGLYDELQLSDPKWSEAELIDVMVAHPALIERPIVETPKGTRLCRPAETVQELIDALQR